MSPHHRLAVLVFFIVAVGCSGIEVSQDYNPTTDFSKLSSYGWQYDTQPETENVRLDNPLVDARIRAAIDRILTANGFQKVSAVDSDFLVSYQTTIQPRVTSNNVSGTVGFGRGSRGRYGGAAISTSPRIREFDEGSIVIDVTDAKTMDLVWRGTATYEVKQHATPEATTESINAAVDKILAQFPPGANR